jgi:hypothetical protein
VRIPHALLTECAGGALPGTDWTEGVMMEAKHAKAFDASDSYINGVRWADIEAHLLAAHELLCKANLLRAPSFGVLQRMDRRRPSGAAPLQGRRL